MARLRFKKPKIAVLMTEVITLTIWLFLGDRIINILDTLIGDTLTLNTTASPTGAIGTEGCDNNSVFEDAYEILGIGYSCEDHVAGANIEDVANSDDGLLGVIGLVMVVMVLMNFVTYS